MTSKRAQKQPRNECHSAESEQKSTKTEKKYSTETEKIITETEQNSEGIRLFSLGFPAVLLQISGVFLRSRRRFTFLVGALRFN